MHQSYHHTPAEINRLIFPYFRQSEFVSFKLSSINDPVKMKGIYTTKSK